MNINPHYIAALEAFRAIASQHSRLSEDTLLPDTTSQEQHVIGLLINAISEGYVDAYPMRALLEATNNWATLVIVRPTLFQLLLREGVDLGCLGPEEHDEAWEWMQIAAEHNDPTDFLDDDMEQYYDLLMTATEHGNDIAHDLMDRIWEPENIIEED